MTAPPAVAIPPGRTLAAWWRQLAPHRPRRLWLADWLLHRLDVLTRCVRRVPLDPLPRLLLEALSVSHTPSADSVAIRLGIESALAAALLHELAEAELVQLEFGKSWAITDAGREALASDEYERPTFERRQFTLRHDPPAFLPLAGHGRPVTLIDPPPAPFAELRACMSRSPEWKSHVGFPPEVAEVFDLTSPPPDTIAPWRSVPVDRPERLIAALILSDERILAFAIAPDGTTLGASPIFALPATELALPDPNIDAWGSAWRESRGDESAKLEREGQLLIATLAPHGAMAQAELVGGEIWLSAGDANCRELAQVELK